MKKLQILIIYLILVLTIQNTVFAAFWDKPKKTELGNEIVKEDLWEDDNEDED